MISIHGILRYTDRPYMAVQVHVSWWLCLCLILVSMNMTTEGNIIMSNGSRLMLNDCQRAQTCGAKSNGLCAYYDIDLRWAVAGLQSNTMYLYSQELKQLVRLHKPRSYLQYGRVDKLVKTSFSENIQSIFLRPKDRQYVSIETTSTVGLLRETILGSTLTDRPKSSSESTIALIFRQNWLQRPVFTNLHLLSSFQLTLVSSYRITCICARRLPKESSIIITDVCKYSTVTTGRGTTGILIHLPLQLEIPGITPVSIVVIISVCLLSRMPINCPASRPSLTAAMNP